MGLGSLAWEVAILSRMRRCAAGWLSIQSKTISRCRAELVDLIERGVILHPVAKALRIEGVGMRQIEHVITLGPVVELADLIERASRPDGRPHRRIAYISQTQNW
jgi:hypothetical protein